MSRTRLAILTAACLATASLTMMAARRYVLGPEVKRPRGPDTWKVTMVVQGRSTGEAKVVMTTPLDSPRQHVVREQWGGDGLIAKPQAAAATDRRSILWTQRPEIAPGPFRARYDCYLSLAPNRSRVPGGTSAEVPPAKRDRLGEAGIEAEDSSVAELARKLTAGLTDPGDQARALFSHVEESIANEPSLSGARWGAAACLQHGAGDSAAKSRLLAALCRSRGIPTRLVTGLTLTREGEELPHVWVEAWVHDLWLPMCPFYRHFGRVPRTYLVFGYGDTRLARGRNVRGLACAFLVSRVPDSAENPAAGWPRRVFLGVTLYSLPPAEQRLVEFLLLLPVAALVICVFRNVIGVASFGTFAPALVGLVFRDLDNWAGVGVFVGLILTGWLLRRRLDRFHLLQVPRTALLLSCIIVMLVGVVAIAGRLQIAVTKSISLFPIIILTGMVERFWTLEEEDGVRGSFRTLAGTLVIAATVALVVSMKAVSQTLFRYPEALGVVMAGQLLLGRYTGYRLSELIRFRDVVAEEPVTVLAFRDASQKRGSRSRFREASLTDGVEHVLARRGTSAR